MTAEYEVRGAVAVITLSNPPVNGLGHATRSALADGLQKATSAAAVRAIVIAGAGKAFSAGADIREFDSPLVQAEPTLHTLIRTVEAAPKPVIAAIHGICMGGGLELALGCHYRVAAPHAQIALPEVKLGLLPGAGGTQRLPRAVGLERALDMIVSGNPVPAGQLGDTPLFDRIVDGDLLEGALAFAGEVADRRPLPRVRDRNIDCRDAESVLRHARNATHAGPLPAPGKCIDAVEAACAGNFEQGLQAERALFMELLRSDASQGLRYAFFAERAAGRPSVLPPDASPRSFERVAVIGTGTMGSGITLACANAGIRVTLLARSQESLDRGLATIRRHYDSAQKKGRLAPGQCAQRIALVSGTLSYRDIADADIVIEAVTEDFDVKAQVFRQLDQTLKPGAILASNTSTLDLNRLADCTGRAPDVIGLHFFSPAQVMRLLEIVRGDKTAADVLATALALARRLGKTGVMAGVCDGFVGNRMLEQYTRQAGFLLEEGCLPQQVDRAIERFGFAMGPFRVADLVGNDVSHAIRLRRYREKPHVVYPRVADVLCEMGRFGQKTAAGWYDYRPGERTPHPSPVVDEMIVRHSADLGIVRRQIDDEEIVQRLVFALVNEGARILDEGIAQRASDIDTVYVAGYGFPRFRGGPMFYADTVGLPKVLRAIARYAGGRHGDAWQPAPLLERLAAEGRAFTRKRD